MERRRILIFTVALISGAATLGSAVQAAPLPPIAAPHGVTSARSNGAEAAVVSQDEVGRLHPQQVHWGHHGHWHHHWHHRHW